MPTTAGESKRKIIIPNTKTLRKKAAIKKAVDAAKTALRRGKIQVVRGKIQVVEGGRTRVYRGDEIRIVKVGNDIQVEEVVPTKKKVKPNKPASKVTRVRKTVPRKKK